MILARNLKNPRKVLPRNATFFLVFLSRSWIVLIFLFSCQEIRKFSWIVSMILQKLLFLVKIICKDLCQKSQKSKNFLGKKSNNFLGSFVKIMDVLGFLVFLAGIPKFFLNFPTILTRYPTFFLVFLSRSSIVLVSLFSCQEIRKVSWILSTILQKLVYLAKNNFNDFCQKSQK